jgi:hypothetical protein
MAAALKGRTVAGALAIDTGAADSCMAMLHQCESSGNKFVAIATFPLPEKEPESLVMLRTVAHVVPRIIGYKVKGAIKGIKNNFVNVVPILQKDGIGRHIFTQFLPKALETGSFVAAPRPEVVGRGLENIQHALDLQKKGVSAKKIVVTL